MSQLLEEIQTQISIHSLTKAVAILYIIASKALLPLGVINGSIKLALLFFLASLVLWTEQMNPKLNPLLMVELFLIIVSSLTGYFIAVDVTFLIGAIQSLLYELVFGYCLYHIAMREKNIDWFAYSWVMSGIILVGYVFLTGGYSLGKIARLSINESTNVNTIGVFITFAIWCVLYLLSVKKMSFTWLLMGIALIGLFLYYILETVSRKSMIASVFMIGFWLVFSLMPYLKRLTTLKRVIVVFLSIAIIGVIYWKFGQAFSAASVSMNYRMQQLSGEDIADQRRFELFVDAIKVFAQHPLFGVGWNNYRFYSFSGQYSHNTYVEVLACTGIVGAVLAYSMWALEIKSIVNAIKTKVGKALVPNILSLFLVLVFIDAGQIMYYNSTLLMIMHLVYTLCWVGIAVKEENRFIMVGNFRMVK